MTLYVVAHDGGCEGHSLPHLAFDNLDKALDWVAGQSEAWSIAEVPVFPDLPKCPWFQCKAVATVRAA